MLAPHVVSVGVAAALLLMHLPANGLGKAEKDGLRVRIPAIHGKNQDKLQPSLLLAFVPIWGVTWQIKISLSLSFCNFQISK